MNTTPTSNLRQAFELSNVSLAPGWRRRLKNTQPSPQWRQLLSLIFFSATQAAAQHYETTQKKLKREPNL